MGLVMQKTKSFPCVIVKKTFLNLAVFDYRGKGS